MTYHIESSTFYWINTINTIRNVSCGALCACLIITLIIGVCYIWMWLQDIGEVTAPYIERKVSYKEKIKHMKKKLKIFFIIDVVFIIACIFIPNKQTMVEMLVAKTIPLENIDSIIGQVKDLVDYIMPMI